MCLSTLPVIVLITANIPDSDTSINKIILGGLVMKATGYVRKLDSLGRIVLPKSLRKQLKIKEGDNIEMFLDEQGNVVLDKYMPRCTFCEGVSEQMVQYKGKTICRNCLNII
jgi:transcriptional pleiotropic regulator of transition state genes